MKNLVLIAAVLFMPSITSGADDICIHLNGGADVAYIDQVNTLEIWVANSVPLEIVHFAFEICWSSDTTV
jgi:hypothetical protein